MLMIKGEPHLLCVSEFLLWCVPFMRVLSGDRLVLFVPSHQVQFLSLKKHPSSDFHLKARTHEKSNTHACQTSNLSSLLASKAEP